MEKSLDVIEAITALFAGKVVADHRGKLYEPEGIARYDLAGLMNGAWPPAGYIAH